MDESRPSGLVEDMIEHVAKALRRQKTGEDVYDLMEAKERADWEACWDSQDPTWVWIRSGFMAQARAAIEAMREPTEAMTTIGDGYCKYPPVSAKSVWVNMIDTALTSSEGSERLPHLTSNIELY